MEIILFQKRDVLHAKTSEMKSLLCIVTMLGCNTMEVVVNKNG